METAKELIKKFRRWEYAVLCLLALVLLVTHFSVIMQPDEPLFDEIHYIKDARLIIGGEGTERGEHPPLAKLFIVAGIELFGDNPFGWRFFPIVFSVAGIVFFYLICRLLKLSRRVSYLATFLLALENLSWVQGHAAMLDVFSLTFSLAAFWLYLKDKPVLSGVFVGLAALAKLNGALAIVVIGLHWFLTGRKRPVRFLLSMLAAPIAFVGMMPLFDFVIWGQWLSPITRIKDMLSGTGSITFAEYYPEPTSIASRPWEWLLPIWYGQFDWSHFVLPYGGELRYQNIFPTFNVYSYLGMISPTITFFIIPAVIYFIIRVIRGNTPLLFPFTWFLGTYLVLIPASLITDRASFLFYFYPTVGAICLALAIAIFHLLETARAREWGKIKWLIALAVPIFLLGHIIAFIILVPVTLWLSIPIGILLYVFMLRYLGIFKWGGFGDSLTSQEQVDILSETIVE
jgi:predicted membrane-bound dolichyl-phosphate-mannose-protein mannosyltransferase